MSDGQEQGSLHICFSERMAAVSLQHILEIWSKPPVRHFLTSRRERSTLMSPIDDQLTSRRMKMHVIERRQVVNVLHLAHIHRSQH